MIKNENKETDVAKLGDEKLDLKIEYTKIETKKKLRMLDDTIKKFLEKICGKTYIVFYDEQIHSVEMEALNKNKDKIKQIVDYVINLNEEALVYNNSNVLIYNFHRNFYPNEPNGQIVDTLDFKKTYMILQLIKWGVNPFEIRRCLKSNGHDNFNWNKFMEYVMDNKDILWEICYNDCFECENFCKSMNMIRAMYLLNPLFESNENQSDNLKPFEIDFLLQDLSFLFRDGIHFILWYLNEFDNNDGNKKIKEYLLNVPDGYVLKNFVSKSRISEKEDIDKLQRGNLLDLSSLISKNDDRFFDFSEKDFEHDKDFWTLISHLNNDPVLISFFALVAMRKISFTESQMNFIAQKINNQQVINNLRKINQSLDYKIKSINQYGLARRVKLGSVTAILDYAFLKMSRCIGYLGAALFDIVLCIPALIIGGGFAFGAVYGICLTASALWTTTFWIVLSILSVGAALLLIWCFNTIFNSYLKEIFAKFANGMERFYDNGKIVNWLELYNIKHPINQIGDPPLNLETGDIPPAPARTEPYQADSKLTVPNMVGSEVKDQNQN